MRLLNRLLLLNLCAAFALLGCDDEAPTGPGGDTTLSDTDGADGAGDVEPGDATTGDTAGDTAEGDTTADTTAGDTAGDTTAGDATTGDSSDAGEVDTNPCADGETPCGEVCCGSDEICDAGSCEPSCGGAICAPGFGCYYDTCVPNLGTCENFDDCPGDSWCDESGVCLPYGVPEDMTNDENCVRSAPLDGVVPVTQCEWTGPPEGDATEGSTSIYTAPLVADLNLDGEPLRIQPSVVVTTFESVNGVRTGTLRVFDGRTCQEQMRIGGDDDPEGEANRPAYGTQWAIGDLDNDIAIGGHPEIVGLRRTTASATAPLNLYALGIDTSGAEPKLERLWYGRDCDTGDVLTFGSNLANYGPGLWDVNDDGVTEILIDSMIFDADGCLLSSYEDFSYITHNRLNTIANVDSDPAPELVMADRLAEWSTEVGDWVDESYFAPGAALRPGHVAIADLGQYSTLPGTPTPNTLPEIIVVSAETLEYNPNTTGTIRVQTLDGTVVWGPRPLYFTAPETEGGHGGAPTASDFDGDGQVEFAAAANQYYSVYDPDCVAALNGASPTERPGGTCARADDMQGLPDGILWAQLSVDRSSSGTGSSVFDFDGDGAAEAVYGDECYARVYEGATGRVLYSAPASNGTGYELPVIADVDGDFATEIVVSRSPRSGCDSPDPLFPSSGDSVAQGGFIILRDAEDRWAPSRPIWNQHAYHITNVTDDARIPRTSEVEVNWLQPNLNNFRQNTQGELGVLQLADLTAVLSDIDDLCQGAGGETQLSARVCNRGTNPATDGVTIVFEENANEGAGPGDEGASTLCTIQTSRLLQPGQCETVSCDATVSPEVNVFVVVDPEDAIADCHPGNNDGAGVLNFCVLN